MELITYSHIGYLQWTYKSECVFSCSVKELDPLNWSCVLTMQIGVRCMKLVPHSNIEYIWCQTD